MPASLAQDAPIVTLDARLTRKGLSHLDVEIFDRQARGDRSPRRANEPVFAFLNRSGSSSFEPVRPCTQLEVS